jgi:hypothetical protein
MRQLCHTMDDCGLKYAVVQLAQGYTLVVMEYGGRLFGPFADEDAPSITWISDGLSSLENFKEFQKKGLWNPGGDRIWITPEFPFFTKNRADFFNSYTVQSGMDPADYHITDDGGQVQLSTDISVSLFEHQYRNKKMYLEKTIRSCQNPLRHIQNKNLKETLFFGYEQEILLRDETPDSPMEMEIWDVCQINPGGKILIPYFGALDYVDYYNPMTKEIFQDKSGYAAVTIHSTKEHKIGFKSANTIGRGGYLNRLEDGTWYLFIKNFFNDPSSSYIKEPYNKPGQTGCSFFVYINGGPNDGYGGFGEFENTGRTMGGRTGRPQTTDTILYWYFLGTPQALAGIAQTLLGCNISSEFQFFALEKAGGIV